MDSHAYLYDKSQYTLSVEKNLVELHVAQKNESIFGLLKTVVKYNNKTIVFVRFQCRTDTQYFKLLWHILSLKYVFIQRVG